MATTTTGKPTFDQIVAEFQAFRRYMAQRICESNRMQANLQCTSDALDARLQLELQIIQAEAAERPLDEEYIRSRRDKIDERERLCHARVQQIYDTCVRVGAGVTAPRKQLAKKAG